MQIKQRETEREEERKEGRKKRDFCCLRLTAEGAH